MKIEKGKFYSIHYKGKYPYMGTGECIGAYENGTEGRFKCPDGQIGYFYREDILCEINAYNLVGEPKQVGRTS